MASGTLSINNSAVIYLEHLLMSSAHSALPFTFGDNGDKAPGTLLGT